MEPKLIRKDIEYQKKTLIIVSILVACLFIGGSFSLLSSTSETEEVVTFKTGNFNLEVATEGTLSLEGELPKSYDDGFKNNDITLTLTNTGSLEIGKYEVKLEGDIGTTLESNYIRYSVSDDEGKTYLASKLLSETNNIIYTGYNLKTTKVLKVKLWIDEAAGSNALKKSYNGNINVELYQNEDTIVDVVKSKLVSNYSGSKESFPGGLVAVKQDGNLYHEEKDTEIREYRYSGPSVNNYVTFNDEAWRIVGVFKDESGVEHVKIVRNDFLINENNQFPLNYTINNKKYVLSYNNSGFYWNSYGDENSDADWTIAGLQYFLNTEHDENESVNYGYLHYIDANFKNMIEEVTYYLGKGTEKTTPLELYNLEHNESNGVSGNKFKWIGKIALMYGSDVGYAANSKYWNSINVADYTSVVINNSSWLLTIGNRIFSAASWLLTPVTFDGVLRWRYSSLEQNQGQIDIAGVWGRHTVLPTLYLKNNVKITGGTGEQTNPFTLVN